MSSGADPDEGAWASAWADVRKKTADCDEHLLLDEEKVVAWYEVVRRLPGAYGCDAEIVVLPAELELADGSICYGSFNPVRNLISVALLPNPYETIGTLIHEVAHAASNPRHTRHHGYSWRHQYSDLMNEIVGYPLLPLASEYRRRARAECGTWPCRAAALDMVCVVALTTARAHVKISPERYSVVAGRRRLNVKRSPFVRT